jgi:hypothetical protein
MEIACAGCGCVVDRGVIIKRCDSHRRCCCGELPVRDHSESAELLVLRRRRVGTQSRSNFVIDR